MKPVSAWLDEQAMYPDYTSRLRLLLRKIDNVLWEKRLRISTRAMHKSANVQPVDAEHHYYATVPYRTILRVLAFLSLKNADVFVDLGCGKGRAICCAARYNLAEVIGVEYLEGLCHEARRNARCLRGRRAPISVLNVSAEDFDYTRGSVFYLFNPFGSKTLSAILTKLRSGLKARPRELRIVYINPVYEALLENTAWLKRYGVLPDPDVPGFNPTSFWVAE